MPKLTAEQERLCDESRWDFSDLRALYVNCTLKRSPEVSHTQGLADLSIAIMERNGVAVETIRAVDHEIATGVYPDMTEHGWERDDWPAISEKVLAADILVLTSPIWLGEKSSVCTRVIERLYGNSHILNDEGQYAYYGRVGGCLITGNEDGAKHCAMNILYSLQHLGYVIPPQADSAWLGEAGPGPSYLDPGSGGPDNDFTNRNTTFLTWNLLAHGAHAQGRRRDPGPRQPALGVGRRLPLRLRQPGLPLTGGRRSARPGSALPAVLILSSRYASDLVVQGDDEVVGTVLHGVQRLANFGQFLQALAILGGSHLDQSGNRRPIGACQDPCGDEPRIVVDMAEHLGELLDKPRLRLRMHVPDVKEHRTLIHRIPFRSAESRRLARRRRRRARVLPGLREGDPGRAGATVEQQLGHQSGEGVPHATSATAPGQRSLGVTVASAGRDRLVRHAGRHGVNGVVQEVDGDLLLAPEDERRGDVEGG